MAFFRRLFIDFDSFYASVEQQDNEEYRGKPIIGEDICKGIVYFERIEQYSTSKKIQYIINR